MECRFSNRGDLVTEATASFHQSTHERGGTEDVSDLTPTRRLAGRVHREWWRFHCRDGCHVRAPPRWSAGATLRGELLQNETPHPATSGRMAGAQARPGSRDAPVPPGPEAG